ncbi:MAG: DUF2165 family protein [Pseudomonadota bacterium]
MAFDFVLLAAQTATVIFLTGWLTIGALENLIHPQLNSAFTAEVLDMTRMRQDYPDAYAAVAYRRVSQENVQKLLFRIIVTWELSATIGLWVGSFCLAIALFGIVPTDLARALGLVGALLFTATWAGFLVVGNWFCYWFSHEGAQNTHFQMVLWGTATMIFLSVR